MGSGVQIRMKNFRKYIFLVLIIEIVIIVCSNCIYIYNIRNRKPVVARENNSDSTTYRISYNQDDDYKNLFIFNTSLALISLVSIGICIYISNRIVKPFTDIRDMPYELAKGNLCESIKEQKNKYFDKFTWGIDMLRENLEDNKKRELEYQKEKKTLILSLSHDIKTPLSAIKLYTKALEENLYDSQEKKEEVIKGIQRNAEEIEHYVNEIVINSREDFLDLPIDISGVYLDDVVNQISKYYTEKLETIHTKFTIDIADKTNCMLKADPNRLVEVMQNIIENAIKYGDGKEIRISFSEEEECQLITIANSGCTLRESDLPHLFESFYRGSNSKNKEGNGLGLYICKQLMHKMDGDIFAVIKDQYFEVTIVVRKF